MKRSEENRYVNSANLFKFCKEALNIKHKFEVKVIDQHVGAILGYDPADCSHWKKGKKNIRSIHTISTIADHLEIDHRLITDIVSGKMGVEESLQEYRGYGSFGLSQSEAEDLRREFLRAQGRGSGEMADSRRVDNVLSLQRASIVKVTSDLISKADIRSTPVLLPEIISVIPQIDLEEAPLEGTALVESSYRSGRFVIQVRPGEMRPHVRFLVAREVGRLVLNIGAQELEQVVNAKLNLFAMLLLLPTPLFQLAAAEAVHNRDLVEQLTEFFWVSRSIVNARIKDLLLNGD
jgi:hypothetical protein